MEFKNERILWVDCLGGLGVGFVVVVFCQLIASWESLPFSIVLGMGIANLVYGSYSLFVTARKQRPVWMLNVLALANVSWLFVCVSIVVTFWSQISLMGMIHVIGEGVYVAGLGIFEWRWRYELSTV